MEFCAHCFWLNSTSIHRVRNIISSIYSYLVSFTIYRKTYYSFIISRCYCFFSYSTVHKKDLDSQEDIQHFRITSFFRLGTCNYTFSMKKEQTVSNDFAWQTYFHTFTVFNIISIGGKNIFFDL